MTLVNAGSLAEKRGVRLQLKAAVEPNILMYSSAGRQNIARTRFWNSFTSISVLGSMTISDGAVWPEGIKWGDQPVGRHGGGGRGGGERSGRDGRISRVDRGVRSIRRYP